MVRFILLYGVLVFGTLGGLGILGYEVFVQDRSVGLVHILVTLCRWWAMGVVWGFVMWLWIHWIAKKRLLSSRQQGNAD